MKLRYFQKGFNFSQDGPGNRLVYHLQGCNMHCPWCSNPEGILITRACEEKNVEEVLNEILSCKPMFFENGGVTFTGGEASLQMEAVFYLMQKAKENGVSTAIETNATVNLEKLAPVCDYFMIDFKHPNGEKLKEITGVSNQTICENIRKLSKIKCIHLRIPLIHSFNDSKTDLEGFLRFFTSLLEEGGAFTVELLPYHEYGKEKWEKLHQIYTITNGFPSPETIDLFMKSFQNSGFTVIKT